MRAALLLVVGLLAAAPVLAQLADYEKEQRENWTELKVDLPAFPSDDALIPFEAAMGGNNRFFVDGQTLRVDADGVVRYTLVVRAGGGANSISYEGIRCLSGERRLYATGRSDRTWAPSRVSDWRPIPFDNKSNQYVVLYRDFFCPERVTPTKRDSLLRAIRSGRSLYER